MGDRSYYDLSDYDLSAYGRMVLDRIRISAHADAIRQTVTPGAIVLDLGAGTGILSVLACQAGAHKVYAVEPDDAVEVARRVALANGVGDQIEFIRDRSTRVDVPEQVDIVITDIRGSLPLFRESLTAIIDARQRWLAPGGIVVPQRDTLWMGIVDDAELYERIAAPSAANWLGVDMRAAFPRPTSRSVRARTEMRNLLAPPAEWATINYWTLDTPDVRGKANFTVERQGSFHGIMVWFTAVLAEGISFSTGPGDPRTVYSPVFFPLSTPADVAAGDLVSIALDAIYTGGEYVWRWRTLVCGPDGSTRESHDQSSMVPETISLAQLERRREQRRLVLDEEGKIAHAVLRCALDDGAQLGDIARRITEEFPHRFRRWEDALSVVADLAERYGL